MEKFKIDFIVWKLTDLINVQSDISKAIIIDEIKGLFQKEKEKIESQLNQINEELIKINERLKTCEDEINQLKVQLKGNGKNNESNNLH